ncbi:MAG: aminopeptidase, partial [Bacteroidales bacterium]|nr:aminopeptidase [Bacteroidales bacterium]
MMLAAAALGMAFLASGCSGGTSRLTEPGVSLELAQERASRISGLSYEIFLDIPESRDSALSGRETVRFRSERGGKVVLDFVPEDFKVVSVNGKPARARYAREHIVVPVSKGENSVVLEFTPADRYLNRSDEFLYSLFVPAHARTVFPCFDQPDLKAEYQLTLRLPEGWTAVSNTEPLFQEEHEVIFHKTKPISTYLFAFSAGKWQSEADEETGITAYFRETDPAKLAQLHDIFGEVKMAISWLEEYTGIPMPFPKYDFVIVPDFQFGGMEHPGCIFYKAATMFLGPAPTPDERARRIELIAHETAHLWFGDLVTMRWFDDVWIKEVFANQMAAKMAQPMFPEID